MDREKKHVYRHAFLHADRFPNAHPHLDAHAEQHAASHLYRFAHPDLAPYSHFNTHPYPTSHLDSLSDEDTCYTELNVDSISDAYPAPHLHLFLHAHTHPDPNPLKIGDIPHML
jgi:hypothetical protein